MQGEALPFVALSAGRRRLWLLGGAHLRPGRRGHVRVRHQPREENTHTAAVSANAIATVARGQTKGARSRALGS